MDSLLSPGDLTHVGPYRLVGRLGEGGMGTVYLGEDPQGTQVAVKILRSDLLRDDQFRRRFRSEVNRARQVPPFCTAEVLDADPYHEPPYLVVEYIDGPSLLDVVQRQGPLSRANLHSVAVGIATALTAIHGAGVIHRDLKPGNVLFGLGGIKVIDFGIARALDPTSQHTRTNQFVGTIAYMAPERFDHESSSRVGPAADIFAWGAVVAYAGTGRTPFGADSGPATAVRIMTQPPELTGLAEPMRSLVERTLAKEPADRPTTRELLDQLLAAAPGQPAGASRPGLIRDTPFLREVVEGGGPRAPLVPPQRAPAAPAPRRPSPARRAAPARSRPSFAGLLRPVVDLVKRFRIAAATVIAAVLTLAALIVFTADEKTPSVTAEEPASSAPAQVETSAPTTLAETGMAAVLAGERRFALRLAGSDRKLDLSADGRATLAEPGVEDMVFTAEPAAGGYLIRIDEKRCLTASATPPSLVAGSCTPGTANVFAVAPASATANPSAEPAYTITNGRYGVVLWSDDRAEIYLARVEGDLITTAFTLVDRGPA